MKLLCVQVVKDLLGDGIDVSTIHTVQSFNMMTLMHLSILGPTTAWTGKGTRGPIGDLTAFDLKNRPKGWGISLWA